MSKTPNQSTGYYAVRKGEAGIKNCIFLKWEDAQDYVEDDTTAEYNVFDTLQDAEVYLQSAQPQVDGGAPASSIPTTAAATPSRKRPREQDSNNEVQVVVRRPKTYKPTKKWEEAFAQYKALVNSKADMNMMDDALMNWVKQQRYQYGLLKQGKDSSMTDEKIRRLSLLGFQFVLDTVQGRQTYRPTKKWESFFALLKTSLESGEDDIKDERLEHWIKDQRYYYSLFQQGKPCSMTQEKVDRLLQIGFDFGPPSKKRSRQDNADDDDSSSREVQARRSYKPRKKWEEYFETLKQVSDSNGAIEMDDKLKRWVSEQRHQYRLLQQNKPSSMTTDKIGRLSLIGFEFDRKAAAVKNERDDTPGKPRKISKRWHESLAKLKAYMESHDGSWEVDKNDTENAKLRLWVTEQDTEYRKLKQGLDSRMNDEKIQHLQDAGFEFSFVSWEERIAQILAYKAVHGNLDIPKDHAELGDWCFSIRKQWTTVQQTGIPTLEVTPERIQQLRQLGFELFDPHRQETEEKRAAKWEDGFAKLEQYKLDHGDCNVPRKPETQELYNWVCTQRRDYKKLQEGKPSKLTANHLMRLTDLGFGFQERGVYRSWNDRIEELREFKRQHGHVDVPPQHPDLGAFVVRQRYFMKKRLNGEETSMTDERYQILMDLGLKVEDGDRRTINRKTWDERFDQLLEFKEEFGHVSVPVHSEFIPGLGTWVNEQRKAFKLMQEGKKSPMTAVKVDKLNSIGFVFSVFKRKNNRGLAGVAI